MVSYLTLQMPKISLVHDDNGRTQKNSFRHKTCYINYVNLLRNSAITAPNRIHYRITINQAV